MVLDALFYKDCYLKEFTSFVKDLIIEKDKIFIELENTAFYPEGGGQPADKGFINNIKVLDVKEKNGKILHQVEEKIEINTKVICKIDFDFRYRNMQTHSGEHILSGLICKKYDATNVGFHMGENYTTLDFNKSIPFDDFKELERLANEAIYKGLDIKETLYSSQEAKNLTYRSKKELDGTIRIIEIPGYDICACCGTHVKNTSEIGILKIIKVENYKGGVRIYMLAR